MSENFRTLVFGDCGMLGQALVQYLGQNKHSDTLGISLAPFQPTPFWSPLKGHYTHKIIDVLKEPKEVAKQIEEFRPHLMINCIALVNLSLCESDVSLAKKLHVDLPKFLGKISFDHHIGFVQISTDQVFDGIKGVPYCEEDTPHPINNYGRTKWEGECETLSVNPEAMVIRTNIVGFRDLKGSETFVEWLWHSLLSKNPMTLFENFITSPIFVGDFSRFIL